MSWFPANNQYDGVNSTVVDDVELNAPYYKWDLNYFQLEPVKLEAPLLTAVPGSYDPDDPDQERRHCMRVMVVPPEKGKGCC